MSEGRKRKPEWSLPARAQHKRLAAERREAQAARLRSEAAEIDRQWREFKAAHPDDEQVAS
jgi:hypothetical protein